MSKKAFTATLLCMALAFAGFAGWVVHGIAGHDTPVETGKAEEKAHGPVEPAAENLARHVQADGRELAEDADLSRAIRALTDETLPENVRLDLARRIDASLGKKDVDYLYSLLHHNPEAGRKTWWVVLNEIMLEMANQGVGADRYDKELSSVIRDKGLDMVARDYAVQHLALWVRKNGETARPGSPRAERVVQAMSVIADTIGDPALRGTTVPGTAVMVLTEATRRMPEETSSQVWQKLDPVLTSVIKGETSADLGMRTSVVQAVAIRGSQAHLPLVRSMARDEKADPSMRLTSIAALGVYGSEEDRAYLESVAAGNDRFRYAAQSALKKFQDQ